MRARRPAQPPPPPETPMAERLEQVRTTIARAPSLREFWRQVSDGWPEGVGEPVSYEAVRNYHYNRDAPVSYLVAVSKVFGVPLSFLATGEHDEPAVSSDWTADDVIADATWTALDALNNMVAVAVRAGLHVVVGVSDSTPPNISVQLERRRVIHRPTTSPDA